MCIHVEYEYIIQYIFYIPEFKASQTWCHSGVDPLNGLFSVTMM